MVKKKGERQPPLPVTDTASEWERALAEMPDGPMKRMMSSIRVNVVSTPPDTDIADDAKAEAKAFHDAIPTSAAKVQEQLPFLAPLATDLCRVSFFFPLNRNEKRDFLENLTIMKNAWGEISFLGPRLSTQEEDVFLVALAMAKIQSGGYVYDGPVSDLIRVIVRSRNPSAADYRRVYRSLRLLSVSTLELRMNRQHTVSLDNIITSVKWNKEQRRIKIVFNPYFAEKYAAGAYTLLGIEQRLRLRGPVAKALHRFVSSQRETWTGHYLALAAALNVSSEQPGFAVRRTLKVAITELVKAGVLRDSSGFANKDQVLLQKIPAKPARKVRL